MGYKMTTNTGLDFYHVTSAFQKCIRRGMQHEALYYGTELYISGYSEYCWYRLLVISSEDVGLANPILNIQIKSLYDTYTILKKKKNKHEPERLPFTHAILLCVRSQKSRIVDNILCEYFALRDLVDIPDFPDFVFDCHTVEGKKMGRGTEHFYSESAKLDKVPKELSKEEFIIRDRVRDKYLDIEKQN